MVPSRRLLIIGCLMCGLLGNEVGETPAVELAGITVTPHRQSANMRWRRPPDERLGARVELFLKNDGPASVRLSHDHQFTFDGQAPEQLIASGQWAWHDTPSVWQESAIDWAPQSLLVLQCNTRIDDWGVGTTHVLKIAEVTDRDLNVELAEPEVWISAVIFRGADLATPPTSFLVHVTNQDDKPLMMKACRVWIPEASASRHVFRASSAVPQVELFPDGGEIAAGAKGCLVIASDPLPLGYGVLEVTLADQQGGEQSLWAYLRIKPEVFDISGGWVASDVKGRNSLTLEPYLQTLQRMHINTAHIGDVPGYTDNAQLYAKYPLKLFNRLEPFARYDNEQMLPRVHAVEFLGEPQYGGGRPVAPQKVWEDLAPYQATRLPTTVTHSEERIWRDYAGLSDYPHYDAYRVCAPAADNWAGYERWGEQRLRWGAPLETIGDMTRSLRELNRPRPIAYWSQGAHAGWDGRRGRARSSPTPDELRAQAYHALGNRITSLYWFNLSWKSLLKYPDLIAPITRVNREIRLIDSVLLDGDAYEYRRIVQDGAPQWDLSSVASPGAGLFFAHDLAYEIDAEKGEFVFRQGRAGEFVFRLPSWLNQPAEVFRVDADGTHDVEHVIDSGLLVVRDRVSVAGIYIAARQAGWRADTDQRYTELISRERAVGFDPAENPHDLATLRQLGE